MINPIRVVNLAKKYRLIPYAVIFALFACQIIYAVSIHTAWRDEAQIWLIARDSNPLSLLAELRYEGHPGFWYFLLMPFAKLGLPFATMTVIHVAVVLAIAYIICFHAPFHIIYKFMLLFCTSIYYHASVYARNYAPAALLALIIAVIWNSRLDKMKYLYGALMILLANSSAYSAALAGSILAGELLLAALEKRNLISVPIVMTAAGLVLFTFTNLTPAFAALLPYPADAANNYLDNTASIGTFFSNFAWRANYGVSQIAMQSTGEMYDFIVKLLKFGDDWITPSRICAVFLLAASVVPVVFTKGKLRFLLLLAGLLNIIVPALFVGALYVTYYPRHSITQVAGIILLYWIMMAQRLNDRISMQKVPQAQGSAPAERCFNRLCLKRAGFFAALIIVAIPLLTSFRHGQFMHTFETYDKISDGPGAAAFMRDNGYDTARTLVVAPSTPLFPRFWRI
jgi:hypothetical protein